MTDLGMMTGKAALRLAKEESGLTRDEIAERLGHESMAVTMTYSHLYPSMGRTMADRLGEDRNAHQKGA